MREHKETTPHISTQDDFQVVVLLLDVSRVLRGEFCSRKGNPVAIAGAPMIG